ncbi:hypothetical protein LUD75_18540 [Epilithonimonas sp. JDS]|uniref:hypothetical protein n=1 Tax=Epilithonimonas sp. JDS TaxID=2902797 RepID=UPI001E5DE5F4|nr:hypothetical protein [Epilithonimonas sp. JDS]MCD9856729.1 hypothetical protein [Epilithonimonas sp. JDS]
MLAEFADFSDAEIHLFNKNICRMNLDKNAVLSKRGAISKSIFLLLKAHFTNLTTILSGMRTSSRIFILQMNGSSIRKASSIRSLQKLQLRHLKVPK